MALPGHVKVMLRRRQGREFRRAERQLRLVAARHRCVLYLGECSREPSMVEKVPAPYSPKLRS